MAKGHAGWRHAWRKSETTRDNDSDAFLKTLSAMKDNQEVEAHVKQNHPILLIEFLKASKKDDRLSEFCKGLRDDYKLYTFYIQDYLLPWFESLSEPRD